MAELATAADVTAAFNVSRETADRLDILAAELMRWNRAINLVSAASIEELWHRHIADSAQLVAYCPATARTWLDLGSGAGFPGLVVAILAVERAETLHMHLVESDGRKAVFLSTMARTLEIAVSVHATRIATLALPPVDVVSARALAPLRDLVAHTVRLRRPSGTGLFPKGEAVHKELVEARRLWVFDHRLHRSRTDRRGAIVEIGAVHGPR